MKIYPQKSGQLFNNENVIHCSALAPGSLRTARVIPTMMAVRTTRPHTSPPTTMKSLFLLSSSSALSILRTSSSALLCMGSASGASVTRGTSLSGSEICLSSAVVGDVVVTVTGPCSGECCIYAVSFI